MTLKKNYNLLTYNKLYILYCLRHEAVPTDAQGCRHHGRRLFLYPNSRQMRWLLCRVYSPISGFLHQKLPGACALHSGRSLHRLGCPRAALLTTIILSSAVLYEIAGPASAKASLILSGSITKGKPQEEWKHKEASNA